MTLLLTWVTPDGIVMGADSAISWKLYGQDFTVSDAYKIAQFDKGGVKFGVSFCGTAFINKKWVPTWLRDYIRNYTKSASIPAFTTDLAKDLNSQIANGSDLLCFQIAGWEATGDQSQEVEPRFYEVSNLDRQNSPKTSTFTVADILPQDFVLDIKDYRKGVRAKGYPMRFGSAGIPAEFSTKWIAGQMIPAHKGMIGSGIPFPNITSVAEYVRFLIGSVADLQRVARKPATVNHPIETLILFPEWHKMVSTRY